MRYKSYLSQKTVNVTEWKSTSYEQPQAGNESDHSDGEVSGNNVE